METFTIKIPKIRLPRIQRVKAVEPPPTGIVQFMMQNPVWTETSLKNLAVAGYQNCMTIFACVRKLTTAAGGIPWNLFRKASGEGSKRNQIYDHKCLNLIKRPNPRQAQSRFIEGITGFYFISGNSYTLEVSAERENAPPRELHWLYPHEVEVLPGDAWNPVRAYDYMKGKDVYKQYPPEDVLHLKSFHPTNFWYGLSPIKVAARGVDTLNTAEEWNMKLIQNEMRPSGAIKVEGRLNPKQRKTFRKEIMESLSGSENAGMPMILEGAQEWMPFSISPKDADWLNSQKLTVRFVCLTLGIPPELMADAENKTYSNVKEARKSLYEETILPWMDFLRDELNNWLVPRFGDGLELDYDRDSIEALREDRKAVFDRANTSDFLTDNEKRLMCGFDEIPGGNVVWKPINKIPMGEKGNGEKWDARLKIPLKIKSDEEGGSFWTVPERKFALWTNFVEIVKAKEKVFENLADGYLEDQIKRIKGNLGDVNTMEGFYPEMIFDVEEEAKEYREKMRPWYVDTFAKAFEAGMEATKGELYVLEEKQAEIPAEFQSVLNELILETGIEVNETILADIYRVWTVANLEGWALEEFKKAIPAKMEELSPGKVRNWKRTQTAKIENWGNVEGYKKQEFVTKKGWLSAFAPTSRDAHMRTNEQEVLLGEPFMIDGKVAAQYPGGSGLPEHDINCLCSTYPVVVNI